MDNPKIQLEALCSRLQTQQNSTVFKAFLVRYRTFRLFKNNFEMDRFDFAIFKVSAVFEIEIFPNCGL